jgi:FkbM family methyltransferase
MKKFLRALYRLLPFKKTLFTALRWAAPPLPERIYRHLHFRGVFRVNVAPGRSFHIRHYGQQIENTLFWRGLGSGWESVSIGLWIRLCRRAETILDLGANTGVYALIAQTVNPGARVHAFEPVRRVFEKLEANVRLNGFAIACHEAAVSDRDGRAVIYDLPTEHILSVTVNKNLHPEGTEVIRTEIKTVTLASFIEAAGLERIDLMKIDVETHEPEVLAGMGPYLEKFRPALLIEILNGEVAARIAERVAGLGYLYFNIDENKGVSRAERITPSAYYNFLLCDPATARALALPV